uniref:ATP-dependent DNA helicase n=1 Tax=Heterorhabditis bacteriophora TaxID=37862 RepID=A0A1I7WA31_HETBA
MFHFNSIRLEAVRKMLTYGYLNGDIGSDKAKLTAKDVPLLHPDQHRVDAYVADVCSELINFRDPYLPLKNYGSLLYLKNNHHVPLQKMHDMRKICSYILISHFYIYNIHMIRFIINLTTYSAERWYNSAILLEICEQRRILIKGNLFNESESFSFLNKSASAHCLQSPDSIILIKTIDTSGLAECNDDLNTLRTISNNQLSFISAWRFCSVGFIIYESPKTTYSKLYSLRVPTREECC